MLEQRGIPTVVMGTYEFEQLARLEAKNRGLADLPLALIPHPLGGIREDEVVKKAELAVEVVLQGASPAHERRSAPRPGPSALDGAYAAINRHYQERGWTDGLPIVPPTEDDVREFLRFTDRDPREVVAVLPPRQGEATVERIAVNAVMAGCRPEYLPGRHHRHRGPGRSRRSTSTRSRPPRIRWRRSSSSTGRSRRELGINAGYNAFGQGFRANVTIGRAVRLLLMNVGGGLPGTGDRATQGSPAKIAYCVAENEDANPWEPLHVEHGFPADVSMVTAIGVRGPAQYPGPLQLHGPRHPQDHRRRHGPGGQQQPPRPAATRCCRSGPSTRPPSRATGTPSGR